MTTVKRRRRRRIDLDIEQDIVLLADGHSPTQVHRELGRRYGFAEEGGRAPALHTVQRVMADITPKDAGAWSVAKADPDDAALVLPALGAAIERTQGRVRRITRAHADWICHVSRALPSIPPWPSYALARHYLSQTERGLDTDMFDELLAVNPWGNPQRYAAATRHGWVRVLSPRLLEDLGLLEDQSNG